MKKLTKRVLSLTLVTILCLSFVTTAYGNEITDMYNTLFSEYTISGTVIENDGNGIYIELDNPITDSISPYTIKYAFIEGKSNLSSGSKFISKSKYQMLDVLTDGFIVIGVFTPSNGSITITPPEEEYYTQEETDKMFGWMDDVPTDANLPSYNSNTTIYSYPRRNIIDSVRPYNPESDDLSLLRMYTYNPGIMHFGMSESYYDTLTFEWTEPYMTLIIGHFTKGNPIKINGTIYFPLTAPLKYYGYTFEWHKEAGVLTINDYLDITPGSNIIKDRISSVEIAMNNKVEIINNILFAPIEIFEKAFPESNFKVEIIPNPSDDYYTTINITRGSEVFKQGTPSKVITKVKESVIHNNVVIDTIGDIEAGMDVSLLRLYLDNTGYLSIGMEPPVRDESTGQWIYSPLKKIIKDFNNGGKTFAKNGTYYLPMREVIEYYGHTVNWTPETGVDISGYLYLSSGSNIIKNTRNNVEIKLDNNIEIIDGVTYVPIDFLQKVFPENKFKWTTQDRGNGCISIDITQEVAG